MKGHPRKLCKKGILQTMTRNTARYVQDEEITWEQQSSVRNDTFSRFTILKFHLLWLFRSSGRQQTLKTTFILWVEQRPPIRRCKSSLDDVAGKVQIEIAHQIQNRICTKFITTLHTQKHFDINFFYIYVVWSNAICSAVSKEAFAVHDYLNVCTVFAVLMVLLAPL